MGRNDGMASANGDTAAGVSRPSATSARDMTGRGHAGGGLEAYPTLALPADTM